MERIAIFPGSFDPITKGHENIIKRALPLFDKIIIAIGMNSSKNCMFDIEKRLEWIRESFKNESKIEVAEFSGLTVDFCKSQNARFILRGLRSYTDFEYEFAIAQMNKALVEKVETVFLLTDPEFSSISSSIVREIIRYKGNVEQFLPSAVTIK